MALAKYFSKDVLAIGQVLNKEAGENLSKILNAHVVELAFDDCIKSKEGQAAFDLLIRLVSRLYPKIKISDFSNEAETELLFFKEKARAINSNIEFCDEQPTISLVVGNSYNSSKTGQIIFYIGSEGWVAKFSNHQPVGSGNSNIPFGAGAAACFGASNLFRFIFKDFLDDSETDNDIILSLKSLGGDNTNDAYSEEIDIDKIILVGNGAIGNGFVWALSNLYGLKGSIDLIDPEELDLSNLQRYVLTEEKDEGKWKAEIAREVLLGENLKVKTINCDWANYVAKEADHPLDKVVVAVDSAEDRVAIQSSLPRIIFNAYTAPKVLGISRHFDFAENACLACGFIPTVKKKNRSQEVADNLGLTNHERVVRELLYYNNPVDVNLLQLISKENNIPMDQLGEYLGQNISEFYTKVVCGGILMTMRDTDVKTSAIDVPLAFQSALAGIILASEIVLEVQGERHKTFQNVTQIYPLVSVENGINPYNHTLQKDTTGRCLCNDPDFVEQYKLKWERH